MMNYSINHERERSLSEGSNRYDVYGIVEEVKLKYTLLEEEVIVEA